MKVATQDEVAANFAQYVKASKEGPVVVTSKGKPVAVLLRSDSADDVERLLMGHSPKLQSILEAARKRFRDGGGIPHETFWKEMEGEKVSKRASEIGQKRMAEVGDELLAGTHPVSSLRRYASHVSGAVRLSIAHFGSDQRIAAATIANPNDGAQPPVCLTIDFGMLADEK